MRQHDLSWLSQGRHAHRVTEVEMRLNRFVAKERTFEHKQIGAVRKSRHVFRESRVRSVNNRRAALIRKTQREALRAMRCRERRGGQAF